MSAITTHVLDTSQGRPAADIRVALSVLRDGEWHRLSAKQTDTDGRVRDLLDDRAIPQGTYRLRFEVGEYFARQDVATFYPYVEIIFTVTSGQHYHVPLLVSPFGYTTYRGS